MFQFGFYAEKLRQWWFGDTKSSTKLTTAELVDLCVEAHGFPPYFGPQLVGRTFCDATQVPVVRIAPSAENTTPTVWILQLDSHASQSACLRRRRFEVDDEDEISLYYPQENLIPSPGASTWTSFLPSKLSHKPDDGSRKDLRTLEVFVGRNRQPMAIYQGYFGSRDRSGGGDIEDIEMDTEIGILRVTFVSPQVVDRVLARKHVIGERQVEVRLHKECLGPSGGSLDTRVFDLPATLVLSDADRHKVAFLAQCLPARLSLCQQLAPLHAKPSITDSTLTLVCTIQPQGRALARSWRKDVKQAARTFLKQIYVHRVCVEEILHTDVKQALAGIKPSGQDMVLLQELYEENLVVVVGMKTAPTHLRQQIGRIVKDMEAAIERKKREITDSRRLELFQLRLLQAAYFPETVQGKFPDLSITIDTKQNIVSFRGQPAEVGQAQLKMDNLLASACSSRVSGLSETRKNLLEKKETQGFVILNIRFANIVAVLHRDSQREVWIHTLTEEDAEVAIVTIRSLVEDFAFDLTPEAGELLQTPGWCALKRDLEGRYRGKLLVTTSNNGQRMTLTATADVLQGVQEDVQRFLNENTIYTETVCFSQNHQKFISLFRRHKLDIINERLKAHKGKVSLQESGSGIDVCGTNEGIRRAKEHLRTLITTIFCHQETITDSAVRQFLETEMGARELDKCGRSNRCVIALHRDAAERGDGMMVVIDNSNISTITSVRLPNGVTLAVVLGDITRMRVDVIVNAADEKMEHQGGLAKAIVDKGGRSIQEECWRLLRERGGTVPEGEVLVSGAGALPCKAVIHAVGPVYQGGTEGEQECLEAAVVNCLDEANRLRYTSIALPAISTGKFHYPADTATRVIVEAVKKYFKVHRTSSVRTVYLVHNNDALLQHFCRAVGGVVPSCGSLERVGSRAARAWLQPTKIPEPPPPEDFSNFSRNRQARHSGPPPKQTPGSSPVTAGKGFTVVAGNVEKQEVDVIVNSTKINLNLSVGSVSGSVLAAAGTALQTECCQKYPNGIGFGGVARTGGAALPCKEVFHIVLSPWSPLTSHQPLVQIINKCLTNASKSGYRSIAFPVLGTGYLQYPHDTAARTMLDTIRQYQSTPSSTLQDIRIVIFPKDESSIQAFEQVLGQSIGTVSRPTGPVRSGRRFDPLLSEPGTGNFGATTSSSAARAEFDIDGLRLVIKHGDLTEEAADAIVHGSNSNLDLSRGGVAQALRGKCGPRLVEECRRKVPEMRNNGFVWTETYGLKTRLILHVNTEGFSSDRQWDSGIALCLHAADSKRVQTLAMPALGTGRNTMNPYACARHIYKAVKSLVNPVNLREVRVVIFNKTILPDYIRAIQERIEDTGGISNRVKGQVPESRPVSLPSSMTLYIYADSMKNVEDCLREFNEHVQHRFTQQTIKDKTIQTIGEHEVKRIRGIEQRHGVEVSVDIQSGRVDLRGLDSNMLGAVFEINAVLRSALLASLVQWYFIEIEQTGTRQVPYGQKENEIIEEAYHNGDKTAEIVDSDGIVYVIDFDSMKESVKNDPSAPLVDVIRKIKMKGGDGGDLPAFWTPMQKDEPVRVVRLKKSDREYQDVEANFRKTLNGLQLTVTAVGRVQNPTLYLQYQAKKAQMTRQNAGMENEKILWHGTASSSIDNINSYGFNRSYCGKHATSYGQGVYFAVWSHYTASGPYSAGDGTGNRYMYQCKVLVGHSVRGRADMRVLPFRQDNIMYDSATSNLSQPTQYVIFNDTQAYPEYLITFK